jgi:DNA-binding IclR family transcriptional regulator
VRCVGADAARATVPTVAPAHCTALGKVLLDHRDAWRRSVLGTELQRCTDRAVTDPEALDSELRSVLDAGYAVALVVAGLAES